MPDATPAWTTAPPQPPGSDFLEDVTQPQMEVTCGAAAAGVSPPPPKAARSSDPAFGPAGGAEQPVREAPTSPEPAPGGSNPFCSWLRAKLQLPVVTEQPRFAKAEIFLFPRHQTRVCRKSQFSGYFRGGLSCRGSKARAATRCWRGKAVRCN